MKIRLLIAKCFDLAAGCIRAVRLAVLIFSGIGFAAGALAAGSTNSVILGQFEAHPTRILAKYKNDVVVGAARESLLHVGARVHRQYSLLPRWVVLEETNVVGAARVLAQNEPSRRSRLLGRIEALKNSGLFEYVEPDYVVQATRAPTDAAFVDGTLWGLRNFGQNGGKPGADISATNAWDLTTGSANVIVGVIDTGIRYTHHDLTNQMWHNPKPGSFPGFTNDTFGINAITGTGDPFDDNNHGTHVSGTIGAAASDGNPSVGVNWHVQLMACKFLSAGGYGFTSDAITCVDYAVFNKARILNNSWGGGGFSQALLDAINGALQKGVLFVAAAGNSGQNNDLFPHYPANYQLDNVISVAALDRTDSLAYFSDYGANTVHLGAPGVDIYSSTAGSDTEYQIFSGTSMAAPHVSGVAALILSLYPSADLSEVRQRILLGAAPIPALNGITTTGGRLNAYNSLTLSGNGFLHASVNPQSGAAILAGSTQPIFVKVTDVLPVRNATVTATVAGVTNLTFADNGKAPDLVANDATYSVNFQVPVSTNPVTMTLVATAPGEAGVTNVLVYNVLPPPPNDFFAKATKVPVGGALYQANNRFATLESGEPSHDGDAKAAASLWWVWTPTSNTNVFVDTTGSFIDTVLAVYTGSALNSLSQVVATNSNLAQHQPGFVSFNAQKGQAYYIAVASASTNALGSIQLRVAPNGRPDITPPELFVTSPASGITVGNPSISVAGTALDPAPDATGVSQIFVSVNGSLPGSASGTANWTAQAFLTSGINTITVNAVDFAGNFSSTETIQVYYLVPSTTNDFFAEATSLTGTNGTISASNTNATKEVGEPDHAGNAGGKSLWWSFLAPADGVLSLNTTNSTFDTLLGLYTGSTVSALTTIAANDDAFSAAPGGFSFLNVAVLSNQTYYIAVDGFNGASGTVKLSYAFVPGIVYHLTANSAVGGQVQFAVTNSLGGTSVLPAASADFASNATVVLTGIPDSGYQFDLWTGGVVSLANPLTLLISGDLVVSAGFLPVAFTDGFETGDFSQLGWTSGGNAPWVVQTNVVATGQFAARSGAITNNQSSSLLLTSSFHAGNASFDYRVSSEQDWDFLNFYVDGNLLQQWSGDVGWATFVFSLNAGTHTLQWSYIKDPSLSDGLDAAFIDNVNLPIIVAKDSSSPAQLQLLRQSDGTFFINLLGQTNQQYILQLSTNLVDWQSILTNTAMGGLLNIPVPANNEGPAAFYRAFVP